MFFKVVFVTSFLILANCTPQKSENSDTKGLKEFFDLRKTALTPTQARARTEEYVAREESKTKRWFPGIVQDRKDGKHYWMCLDYKGYSTSDECLTSPTLTSGIGGPGWKPLCVEQGDTYSQEIYIDSSKIHDNTKILALAEYSDPNEKCSR